MVPSLGYRKAPNKCPAPNQGPSAAGVRHPLAAPFESADLRDQLNFHHAARHCIRGRIRARCSLDSEPAAFDPHYECYAS